MEIKETFTYIGLSI